MFCFCCSRILSFYILVKLKDNFAFAKIEVLTTRIIETFIKYSHHCLYCSLRVLFNEGKIISVSKERCSNLKHSPVSPTTLSICIISSVDCPYLGKYLCVLLACSVETGPVKISGAFRFS